MSARFEFGVAAIPDTGATRLRELAVAAQALGYDRYWVPDQEFLGDPFVLLGDLAGRTTIDLGLAIASPFARHPVQIARAMATLVQLDPSPRDWIVTLGMGNSNLVLEPLGLHEGANAKRLVTAVGDVRSLLAGETLQPADGGFVTAPVRLGTDPARCQVYVGTRGPRTIAAAAPVADGLLIESLSSPALVRWVREHPGMEGDKPQVSWQSVTFLEPGQPIPDVARGFAALLIRTTTPAVRGRLGVSQEVAERAEAKSLAVEHLTDDDVRALVAVGTPDQIRDRVLAAHDAGATGWSSIFLGTTDESLAGIAQFAREVVAPLRRELG